MPPQLSITRQEAPVWQPAWLDEIIHVVEVAAIASAATIAAFLLGLSGLDMLLAIFFSTTLTGQFLFAFLNRMRPRAAPQTLRE